MPQIKAPDPRPYHVVTVSAHCPQSLERNEQLLRQFLLDNANVSLADLAYTTTARRMHHSMRSAYSGSSIKAIVDGINRVLSKKKEAPTARKPLVVFAFTGQGAHYAGMGADLFRSSQAFRATITSLQRICESHGFPPFVQLISKPESPVEKATTVQIHLALIALEIALADLWKTWGITPDLVIGHSIGEYAALYAAGVLSATDAMYIVGRRATLIQDNCKEGTHGMLSISGTSDDVAAILSDERIMSSCEVACRNSPGMIVLSGEHEELLQIEGLLKDQQIKCRLLDVPYAMHSHQMDGIVEGLREAAQGVLFGTPRVKVISTLLGVEHTKFDSDYLVRHTRQAVNFEQAISHCTSHGLVDKTSLWLEIGPNPVSLGLIRSNTNVVSDRALHSLKNGDDNWKSISATLASFYKAGISVQWREYHRDFANSLSLITLPKYAFDTRDFWMKYTEGQRHSEVQPISTCLHRLVKQEDTTKEQHATFTADIGHPSLLKVIQGHKLSGITVCPAGVFSEMSLTAARYLLTNGSLKASFPSLSVLDTQIDHPIMPKADSKQTIQVEISRSKQSNEFVVSIADQAKPSVINSKCVVRLRDEHAFDLERRQMLEVIQPRIAKLNKAAAGGRANRFQGKLFYRLFANLMDYTGQYEGVQEAIVSSDFTEALATVQLPKEQSSGESWTLSPYWIDALTHLAGFLFNGNPMNSGDYVFIGIHMERMEIVAKDLSTDVTYQCYAFIEQSEGSDIYRGHVYILDGDLIVGFLEGARFRKMPRTTLHRILGKAEPVKNTKQVPHPTTNSSAIANGVNGNTSHNEPSTPPVANGVNGTNGDQSDRKSLYSVLVQQLIEETGMEESELTPSTFFVEIGVDSLMSISILAALKAETGTELNASFLMDYPTLEDAQRELRRLEGKDSVNSNDESTMVNGKETTRECNIVLMQGPSFSTSRKPVFLIADGAGSAAAYIHFPKLGQDLPVYAVESPWVNDPENFVCSFDEAAAMYLAAIRSKQPHGPYILGGWSAGGVFAYEVARLLLEAGERVLGLIIIDITGPRHEDRSKVESPTMEIIDQIGMLSGIERNFDDTTTQSRRLKQHMLSTVTCFSKMDPTPMSPGRHPDCTFVIWAKKDILPKAALDTLPAGLNAWFYPSSHDLGPNGWDALVGDKMEYFQIEGDHFSIMTAPEVIHPRSSFCY